jgi:hypothetical protein
MIDPIQIVITEVTSSDEGILVVCTWQWGSGKPHVLRIPIESRPHTADDAREVINRWVRSDAQFEYLWAPVRDELRQDSWTIEFDNDDDDPFEATRLDYEA